ncbi:MAG: hypothetical protein HY820_25995, partial [Acidobacteria bacterium]|nr:hypothetical protein [Acidobacteriota bacterium]
ITQAGTAGFSGPLRFVALAPCRIADTRNNSGKSGSYGPPQLVANSSRDIHVLAQCGVPPNARAFSLNITIVPPGYLGYVTVWPTGSTRPLASTLNSWNGRVVANAAVIPAGSNGSVSVYASDATDVVIDINGYFVPPDVPEGLAFYPVTPCRAADSRSTALQAGFGGPAISGGTARTINLAASQCGIPATARAFSLNVTAMPPGYLGFLTLYPAGQPRPLASTLNSWDGQVVPNAAIVPAGTNGSIDIYASDTTDFVLDINGYFAPPTTSGLNFYPLTPCRVVDTRPAGAFGAPIGSSREFLVLSSGCGAPVEARAYLFNLTAIPIVPFSFLTAWATGQPQPAVSQLNSLNGQVVASAAVVGAGAGGAVSVFSTNLTNLVIDINSYFAP